MVEEDEKALSELPKRKRSRLLCRVQSSRWSPERYEVAEQNMLNILIAQDATFNNPISRPALRTAARKCIGDTGLLDHLLKHIEGKLAPGGAQRFRRWFNTSGVMEYWLESADLAPLRLQAGVQDPYWIPPSGDASSHELKLLKAEFNTMKSDMQELLSRKQEQCDCDRAREIYREMVNWKAETDHNLKLILGSWKSMQEMYGELMAWKTKLEQQVVEIKSSVQEHPISSPQASERWEDWLESAKLDDIEGNEVIPWFDTNPEHGLYSYLPLPPKPTDPAPIPLQANRGEAAVKREEQVNVTPDSCTTTNEFHNSSLLCQEMFVELFNWKAKVEEKLKEISKLVGR